MNFFSTVITASLIAVFSFTAAGAQTIDKRVEKLERKTDFYVKKNKVFRKSSSPKSGVKKSMAAECPQVQEVKLSPGLTVGGNLYVWTKATVTYSGSPYGIAVAAFVNGNDISVASLKPTQTAGVIESKLAGGEFFARAGSELTLRAWIDDPVNPEPVGCVDKLDVEVKTTFIEVVEPQ